MPEGQKFPRSRFDLLALDLDDTLLRHDLSIHPDDLEAIQQAEKSGVRVVLATGRGPQGMSRFWPALGMDTRPSYAVAYNGALVLRTDTSEILFQENLDEDIARQVAQECVRLGYPIQTYRVDEILVSKKNDWTERDTYLTGIPNRLAGLDEICHPAPIKLIVPAEPEALVKLAQNFKERWGNAGHFLISKPYFMEILSPLADKGLALAHLAAILGVPRDRVMAVGDAMNDEGMLRWAGWGVAVANALENVKDIADAVTEKDHNNAGVSEAINRWILG